MASKMKDSGIPWIGEIPEEWELVNLGNVAEVITGTTPAFKDTEDYYANGDMLWVKPDNLTGFTPIINTKEKLNSSGQKKGRILPPYTTLICCIGTIGKFGYSSFKVTTNQQINGLLIKDISSLYWKFLMYFMSVQIEQQEYFSNGNVVKILNGRNQKKVHLALPLHGKQLLISTFLDKKTSEIDRIIENTRKSIEELKAYKQSLITETVTKGLDKNAKMKDSGIPWIGEIPEGWKLKKIKNCTLMRTEKREYDGEHDKYLGLENVESGTGQFIHTNTKYENGIFDSFEKGDILFGKLRPYLAKCLIPEFSGCCTGEFLVIKHFDGNMKYLKYLILSTKFIDLVNSSTFGSKMPRANIDFIKEIVIPFPDKLEQEKIIQFIYKKDHQINSIIENKKRLLLEMEKYKKSMIYEYVTGKKEI